MRVQLSDHFTYPRLLRFTLPSITMMIFTSIYGVVDGLFVSNFVGKTAFAAVNFIMPLLMGLGALGFMVGSGGSALVSRTLGEGDRKKAERIFSMLVYTILAAGVALTLLGQLFLRPIAAALGAEGEMLESCVLYGRIVLLSTGPFMLQNVFQSFFVVAERPQLGLTVTVAAGLTNMTLDLLFVGILGFGLPGAAAATVLSECLGGLSPMVYFFSRNTSLLHLGPSRFDGWALFQTCTNGASELMTNLSMSLVNMLYNLQLMRLAGENGVAAYGVIMYVNFIFVSIFLGYSMGCAPVIGFHFGAAHRDELHNLFRKSLTLVTVTGCALTLIAAGLAAPLCRLFVGYDPELFALTCRGLRLYSLSFLLVGFNIFGSAFFTALGNGAVSACISFLRTLLFQVAAVLLLPLILQVDGIWLAIVVAETLALLVTVSFFLRKREEYGYA